MAAGLPIVLLLVVGSLLLWSRRLPCEAARKHSDQSGVVFPIYVGRAAYLGLWHLLSLIADYRDGLELSFIYAAISIADYQPFGPRCRWGECQAGTVLVFLALIAMVVVKLYIAHRKASEVDISISPTDSPAHRMIREKKQVSLLVILSVVLAQIGSIIIWSSQTKGRNVGGQEAWDVFSLLWATYMMLASVYTEVRLYAVVSMAMSFSVMNRTLGANEGQAFLGFGTCPPEWVVDTGIACCKDDPRASGIRVGYIMLFIGLGLSFTALFDINKVLRGLNQLKEDLAEQQLREVMQAERRVSTFIGIVILLCVAYLWSDVRYYGQLGFTAIIYMASALTGPDGKNRFEEGLNFAYLAALLQVPALTPFTTCEQKDGGDKLVILLCLICLVSIVYQHVSRRGLTAHHLNRGCAEPSYTAQQGYERIGDGGGEPLAADCAAECADGAADGMAEPPSPLAAPRRGRLQDADDDDDTSFR